MKTKSIFLSALLILGITVMLGCGSANQQTEAGKNEITNPISDQVQSELTGITITISYDTNFAHKDYNVEAGSTAPMKTSDNKYDEKNPVNFPCTGESMKLYRISADRVQAVIKTKYDMGVYERTDYVFTTDSLYIVNTSQKESNLPKVSYVYVLPSLDSKLEYDGYFSSNKSLCSINKKMLYQVINFCTKNNVRF